MVELLAPLGEHELIHLGCGEGTTAAPWPSACRAGNSAGIDIAKNAIFAANKAQPDGSFRHRRSGARPLLARQGPGAAGQRPPRSRQSSWSTGWRRVATCSTCSPVLATSGN